MEAQLAARLGRPAPGSEQPAAPRGIDDELFATSQYQRKDDLELGPSWITGITEVPLSMDQRLKNIEDTETAKKKMLTRSGMVRCVRVCVWGCLHDSSRGRTELLILGGDRGCSLGFRVFSP